MVSRRDRKDKFTMNNQRNTIQHLQRAPGATVLTGLCLSPLSGQPQTNPGDNRVSISRARIGRAMRQFARSISTFRNRRLTIYTDDSPRLAGRKRKPSATIARRATRHDEGACALLAEQLRLAQGGGQTELPYRNSSPQSMGSTFISFTSVQNIQMLCRSSSRTVGPDPSSSS